MEKLLIKILRWFCNTKLFTKLDNNKTLSKVTKLLKDEEFVIHIFRYLVAGVLATIVNLASFKFLRTFTTLNENVCNIISIILAILFAYCTNRTYVFKSQEKNIAKEFIKFLGARVISALYEIIAFFIMATLLKWDEMLAKIINQVVIIILNYILSKLMVFNKKE